MTLKPLGVLEKAFDRYGKDYQMLQIHIPSTNVIHEEETVAFKLYFESGSGMEDLNNTEHVQRRNVLLTVLTDVENFLGIKSPDNKVNIWVRAINQASNSPCLRLGLGSSLYNVLENNTGRIADGEVWKTLISDINAYTNVVNTPNDFYHGILAFNFSTCNGNTISWHTDLSTAPASRDYDLYSVMLKETMHLLGVTSLMNAQGSSVFGANYKYYSRFDTKLKNHANTHHLLKNTGNVSLYNWSFNTNLSLNVLRPGCTLPNHTNPNMADNSSCSNALKYVGSVILPVYTPTCFEIGNSLSTFEDELFPNCLLPHGNNTYFVMSNRNNSGTLKRYPKPEERLVLADLGYSLEAIYGLESTYLGYTEYDEALGNEEVVGVNDGINPDLTFTFYGEVNQNLTINGAQLLGNDFNAIAFEGLQLVSTTGSLSANSGNSSSSITFNSSESGLHVLRYVPKNGNISGNITYFYVYLRQLNLCGTANVCNLVINGGFEQMLNNIPPNNISQITRACNWEHFNVFGTPDYYHRNSTNAWIDIPNNLLGQQDTLDPTNNHAYAGFYRNNWGGESFRTELSHPLLAGQTYKLSFHISKSETINSNLTIRHEAFLTSQNFNQGIFSVLDPILHIPNGIHLVSEPITNDLIIWEKVTMTFTANGGEKYLYLGGGLTIQNINVINPPPHLQQGYYYIDNVYLNKTNEITNAVDDSFTFSFSNNAQNSVISVLNNDLINGQLINASNNVSITQINPGANGIIINANGTLTIPNGLAIGSYVLQYFFNYCNLPFLANVIVIITNSQAVFQVDDFYRGCEFVCQMLSPQLAQINLFESECWINNTLVFPHGVLLNSLPATIATATVELAPGESLPAGITLNPDATLSIAGATTALQLTFNVVFRSVAVPSATSDPVEVRVYLNPYFQAVDDYMYFNSSGMILPGFNNNVTINDKKLISCIDYANPQQNWSNYAPVVMPTDAIVVETSNNSGLGVVLNPNGTITVNPATPAGSYEISYQLCHPSILNLCSPEAWIFVTKNL